MNGSSVASHSSKPLVLSMFLIRCSSANPYVSTCLAVRQNHVDNFILTNETKDKMLYGTFKGCTLRDYCNEFKEPIIYYLQEILKHKDINKWMEKIYHENNKKARIQGRILVKGRDFIVIKGSIH